MGICAPHRFCSEYSQYGCASRSASETGKSVPVSTAGSDSSYCSHVRPVRMWSWPVITFDFVCSIMHCGWEGWAHLLHLLLDVPPRSPIVGFKSLFWLSMHISANKMLELLQGFFLTQVVLFCMETSQSEPEKTWPNIFLVQALTWM